MSSFKGATEASPEVGPAFHRLALPSLSSSPWPFIAAAPHVRIAKCDAALAGGQTSACLLPLTVDAWAADHERRGSGRGIVAPGARAIARHVRGSATVCPGRRLLASASLPAVARERGKASPAGRRAWQARSSWPHHGRCKCA